MHPDDYFGVDPGVFYAFDGVGHFSEGVGEGSIVGLWVCVDVAFVFLAEEEDGVGAPGAAKGGFFDFDHGLPEIRVGDGSRFVYISSRRGNERGGKAMNQFGEDSSDFANQKFAETDRLRAALAEIVGDDAIGNWMRTPNTAFEGQTPIQVVERGESDRLWRMIFQIKSRVAS